MNEPISQTSSTLQQTSRKVDTDALNLIGELQGQKTTSSYSAKLAEKEEEYKFKDGERGEKYRIHIHLIVVAGMYVIGFIMIALILVRSFHFVSPLVWRWLDEKDLHNIERIVFSGIILSLATKYFKKYKIMDE